MMNALDDAAPGAPILRMEGIAKSYNGTPVLRDLTLEAAAGELTVVYGPPGSGKSVLMRVLTGLEAPDAGQIILRGEDVTYVPPADRNIGYVPQSFALYPHLSVRANIAYPLDLAAVPAAQSREVVAAAAAMLKIEEHLDKKPDQLSGGQKQRVAIARGIAKRTDVFVLDDPLAGLDFKLREQLVDDLRGLKAATGASILYVTSDVVEAMTLADDMAVLSAGTVIESGSPERLYHAPRRAGTMVLVGFPPANFLPGSLERRDGATWCRTPLFSFVAELPGVSAQAQADVLVGVRPESLHLNRRPAGGNGQDWRGIQFPAQVMLREDLGGEDVVYLDANAISLTMVDREHVRDHDLDTTVTVATDPQHLALFDAATGAALGHGARASHPGSPAPTPASRLPTPDSALHHG